MSRPANPKKGRPSLKVNWNLEQAKMAANYAQNCLLVFFLNCKTLNKPGFESGAVVKCVCRATPPHAGPTKLGFRLMSSPKQTSSVSCC